MRVRHLDTGDETVVSAPYILDATELGIWVFSTRMDGNRDYQVLVPTGPLSDQRSRIVITSASAWQGW